MLISRLEKRFLLKFLLKVFTWTPKYVVAFFQLTGKPDNYSLGYVGNKVMTYLVPTQTILQLLYSQLNPILYLLLLKKFGDHHLTIINGVKHFCFHQKIMKESKVLSVGNNSQKSSKSINPTKTGLKVLVFVSIFLPLSYWAAIHSSTVAGNQTKASKSLFFNSLHKMVTATSSFKAQKMAKDDIIFGFDAYKVKTDCSASRGFFSFSNRRCYFVSEHSPPGLNLTEQDLVCRKQGGILSYPRTPQETKFMWDYFEAEKSHLGRSFFTDAYLHVGFKRQRPVVGNYATFTSIDGKMAVSPLTDADLFQGVWNREITETPKSEDIIRFVIPRFEKGPGLCFSKMAILVGCMPRSLNQFSMCSIDF